MNNKPKKYKTNEYKLARIIISCCFVGLVIGYAFMMIFGSDELSFLPGIIMILAGVLLFVLGIIVKEQNKKVELEYEEIVVYKLCCVAGILIILFGIFSVIFL